jgi:2-dehydro-3-deoxyphosphogluconate aldolase/(4S)-4-hydroxy-2-oxoglutarate aldolase
MSLVLEHIARLRLIPIVVIDEVEQAGALGDALVAGGLPIVEVTFRTGAAEGALRSLAKRSDLIVGAGTILTTELVDRATDAGAGFLLSPGTNPRVVEHALRKGITMIPGVATPSEIELALSLGASALKFFPAESLGGAAAIEALAGPYPAVQFVPTGGITAERLPHYLRLLAVLACGGSWLAPRALVSAGRFDEIRDVVARAATLVREYAVVGGDSRTFDVPSSK